MSQMKIERSKHTPGAMKRVLFLCTGNYYRSRYAEELFNHSAKMTHLAWRAFSRGAAEKSSSDNIGPISPFALNRLLARGVVPENVGSLPQPCSTADFDKAAVVVGLKEAEHRPLIERRFPDVAKRVLYWQIDDIGFLHPSKALALIDREVGELVSTLSRGAT